MITEAPDVREKLSSLIGKLDEVQLAELLRYVETFYFVSVMQSTNPCRIMILRKTRPLDFSQVRPI